MADNRAEIRLISMRQTAAAEGAPSAEPYPEADAESLHRMAEAVVHVANELARTSAANVEAAQLARKLEETARALEAAQTAAKAAAAQTERRDKHLAMTIETLLDCVRRLDQSQNLFLSQMRMEYRRASRLAMWAVLLAGAAVAGTGVCLAFLLLYFR
jgi:CHASE3 domain sensor protein